MNPQICNIPLFYPQGGGLAVSPGIPGFFEFIKVPPGSNFRVGDPVPRELEVRPANVVAARVAWLWEELPGMECRN